MGKSFRYPENPTAQLGDIRYGLRPPSKHWIETGSVYAHGKYPELAAALPEYVNPEAGSALTGFDAPVAFMAMTTITSDEPVPFCSATDGTITVVGGLQAGSVFPLMTSTDGTTWIPRSPAASFNTGITSVAYGNGVFVIGGSSQGQVAVSTNGIDWKLVLNPSTPTTAVQRIIWSSALSLFILVGKGFPGSIYTSPDGYTWTPRVSGAYGNFYCVAANATTIVAAGSTGTAGVYYSTDSGVTWTRTATATVTANVLTLNWDSTNSLFIATGASATIYTSPDGITWTSRTSNISGVIGSMALIGTTWVASSGTGITTSTNATAWTSRTSNIPTGATLYNIQNHGGTLYGVCSKAVYLTSTDGTTWTANYDPALTSFFTSSYVNSKVILWGNTASVLVAGGTRKVVASSIIGSFPFTTPSINNLPQRIAYGAGVWVMVGAGGRLFSSSDGYEWTLRATTVTSLSVDLYCVIFANSLFVAAGGGGALFTSTDGLTWTSRTSNSAQNINSLAYGNGAYVAVANSGVIVSSSDGTTWTARTSNAGSNLIYSVLYVSSLTLFIAVAAAGVIVTSTDGTTWVSRTSNLSTNQINYIAFGGGTVVVASANSATATTAVAYSTDGTTYTAASLPRNPSGAIRGLTYGNSVFQFPANDASQWSADGITWYETNYAGGTGPAITDGTSHVCGGPAFSSTGKQFVTCVNPLGTAYAEGGYANGLWFLISSGNGVIVSSDGQSWKLINQCVQPLSQLYSVDIVNGVYFALGINGMMFTSTDGSSWTYRWVGTLRFLNSVAYGAGTYVVTGEGGTIFTSTDLATWTPRSYALKHISPTETQRVIYSTTDSKFILIGGPVSTSSDGIAWTFQPRAYVGANGSSTPVMVVAFNGGFVVMAANTLWFLSFSAGDLVAVGPLISAGNLTGIAAGGGRVVVGTTGGSSYYTADGVSWRSGKPVPLSMSGLTYYAGQFIAVGASWVASSTNGVDWFAKTAISKSVLSSSGPASIILTTVRASDGALLVPNTQGMNTSIPLNSNSMLQIPLYSHNRKTSFYVPRIGVNAGLKEYMYAG